MSDDRNAVNAAHMRISELECQISLIDAKLDALHTFISMYPKLHPASPLECDMYYSLVGALQDVPS
jgi:hypothetical protein